MSRVNQIPFEGIDIAKLKNYINEHFNVQLSDIIFEYLDGSIGKAIDIINNNLLDKFYEVDKFYEYINNCNTVEAMKYSTKIEFDNTLLEYLEFILYKDNKFNCIKIVENAKNRLKFNGNYDIIIDSMLLKLIDSIKEE